MARKPNYGFEKRKKELDRQAKKNEKLRRKREAGEQNSAQPEDLDTPPAADESDTTSQ